MTYETALQRAGNYNLAGFYVKKYARPDLGTIDFSRIVHTWELNESLDNGYMYGSATIYDSGDFLDKAFGGLGLVGEETISIGWYDWYKGEAAAFNGFIYSITNVKEMKTSNETYRSYVIHFVSQVKFESNKFKIRRSFSGGKISEYVDTILRDYFGRTAAAGAEIEETYGTPKLVVPNYSPDQALHFMARKAVSNVNQTQTFRFFENKRGFHFRTHEDLIENARENPISYAKFNEADSSAEAQERLLQSIIDIEFPLHVNTFEDMNSGAYYHTVTELDINTRQVYRTDYNHLENYSTFNLPDGINNVRSKHSANFIQNYFRHESQDNLVIKDYHNIDAESAVQAFTRPYAAYTDIYNKKKVNLYHHTSELVTMKVYGRNDVAAGDVINIDLFEVSSDLTNRGRDEKRSGRYLIESIKNVFHEENFYQIISMSKSGFKGVPEPFVAQQDSREILTTLTNIGNETDTQGGGNNDDGGILV